MAKRRLLFVNDEMTMGGVARILVNMLGKLDPEDFDIDVLILHPHGELMKEIPDHVRILDSTRFFRAVDVNFRTALSLGKFADVWNKAILLLTMKTGLINPLIRHERKRIGLDSQPYDTEIAAKEGFCSIFVANGHSRRKLNWIHVDYSAQNYSVHHMGLMRKSLKAFDLNIAVSRRSAKAYQDLFGVKRIITINNPMDTAKLATLSLEPCPITYPKETVNLVTVARFHPQKAVDRLIRAMRDLRDAGRAVRLTIVGAGELDASLRKLCQDLEVEDSVEFVGQKSNPMPYIREADLFVLSSLYEGYPTTVIESFIAGTPVLSTDVSGVHEQIQDGINGWIVPNSQEDLTRKLIEVTVDKAELRKMRENLETYTYDNDAILHAFVSALKGDA